MAVLGESTITATGGPPAGNRVMVSARAADTDNVTAGASGANLSTTPTYSPFFPNVSSVNQAAEPGAAIAKKGWLFGLDTGAISTIDNIDTGTWTLSVTIIPNIPGAATLAIGIRAFQVSAVLLTATAIPLPTPTGGSAGANGWKYSATQAANAVGGALTFTLSMPSTAAVTLVSATKYFYIELVAKFTTNEVALGVNYPLNSFTLTVPALTFSRSASDALTPPTETLARKFIGSRALADSVPALSEALTRRVQFFRTPADSLPALSETLTRKFVGSRPLADSVPALSETLTRRTIASRPVADSLPALSETLSRVVRLQRAGSDTLPAPTESLSRVEQLFRSVADVLPAPTETLTRKVILTRLVADSIPALSETLTRRLILNREASDSLSTGGGTTVIKKFWPQGD